jgi:hypothetical protein
LQADRAIRKGSIEYASDLSAVNRAADRRTCAGQLEMIGAGPGIDNGCRRPSRKACPILLVEPGKHVAAAGWIDDELILRARGRPLVSTDQCDEAVVSLVHEAHVDADRGIVVSSG